MPYLQNFRFAILCVIGFVGISSVFAQIKFPFEENSLVEGSVCKFKHNNTLGICTTSFYCPVASWELQFNHIQPTTCSLSRDGPLVCCFGQQNGIPSFPQLPKGPPAETHGNTQRKSAYWCETSYSRTFSSSPPGQFHVTLVGGSPTKPGEFPHMAAIGWRDEDGNTEWRCGGSLISDKFVLTAAHCTSSRNVRPNQISIGDDNLKDSSPSEGAVFEIAEIIVHPRYSRPILYNDIALLKLQGIVAFQSNLRPACLWQSPSISVTDVIATGYGTTSFGGSSAYDLQKVDLKIYENKLCATAFARDRNLPEGILERDQICAGDITGQRDTCQGDSGGPLQISTNVNGQKIFHVIGVTSFGMACASPVPGIYTRVSSYLDWVESIVWQ